MKKLTTAERNRVEAVRSLATGAATKVELGDEFVDDHILCARLTIDGVKAVWPWCGWEGLAALTYYEESAKAKADVRELLGGSLEGMTDEEVADHFSPSVL